MHISEKSYCGCSCLSFKNLVVSVNKNHPIVQAMWTGSLAVSILYTLTMGTGKRAVLAQAMTPLCCDPAH